MKMSDLRDRTLHILRTMLQVDRAAVQDLIDHRVPITKTILDAPLDGATDDVVIGTTDPEHPTLGALGLINGILGNARIRACYADDGALFAFEAYTPDDGCVKI